MHLTFGKIGSDFIKTIESVFPYTTPYVYPIGLIAQTASVYLTVLVTVERYIAVCHPLKAKLVCTEFRYTKKAAQIYTCLDGMLKSSHQLK